MPEGNMMRWVGIRPTDPREAIPIQPYADFGTQIAKHVTANNQTSIIHTVSNGKNLYLCTATLSCLLTVTGNFCMFVRDDSDTTRYYIAYCRRQADDGICIPVTFSPPLVIPEGWDVCIWSGANGVQIQGFIFGYEV